MKPSRTGSTYKGFRTFPTEETTASEETATTEESVTTNEETEAAGQPSINQQSSTRR